MDENIKSLYKIPDKPLNLRHCEIVTDDDKLQVDLQSVFMDHKSIKNWAYILHDKDDTRSHYHIYLYFGVPFDVRQLCDWFKVPFNFIERIKSRCREDALLYLIHGNESQKHKHQYDPSEVIANFDWQIEVEKTKIIGNWENYSYAQMIAYVESIKDARERGSAFSLLEKLWKQHCKYLSLQTERNLQVVFVCGKAGAGKTYYAKKLCNKLGFDYCMSSSSNDLFNDYMGQKAMILDDLRDKAFIDSRGMARLEDLLKILDNNTSSSVKSRFVNVVLCCQLIIITSSVPLCYWFQEYKYNANDSLQQLYRRISNYVIVTETEVQVFSEIGTDGKPKGNAPVYKNELAELKKKQETTQINIADVFGAMCEPLTDGDMPF